MPRPALVQKALDWIMPALVSAGVGGIFGIYKEMSQISTSLAVAISKIQDHDRRLDNLETLFLNPTKPR
jgi:hypothetical protein